MSTSPTQAQGHGRLGFEQQWYIRIPIKLLNRYGKSYCVQKNNPFVVAAMIQVWYVAAN